MRGCAFCCCGARLRGVLLYLWALGLRMLRLRRTLRLGMLLLCALRLCVLLHGSLLLGVLLGCTLLVRLGDGVVFGGA